MTKPKQPPKTCKTGKPDKANNNLNLSQRVAKFAGFWVVAVREMVYTFKLVYNNFYSSGPPTGKVDAPPADRYKYAKIVCPICDREFSDNDAVVKCPEDGCGEIYHYICWDFSHGCIRPGCLASLENPRNLIIH